DEGPRRGVDRRERGGDLAHDAAQRSSDQTARVERDGVEADVEPITAHAGARQRPVDRQARLDAVDHRARGRAQIPHRVDGRVLEAEAGCAEVAPGEVHGESSVEPRAVATDRYHRRRLELERTEVE